MERALGYCRSLQKHTYLFPWALETCRFIIVTSRYVGCTSSIVRNPTPLNQIAKVHVASLEKAVNEDYIGGGEDMNRIAGHVT